MPATCFDRTRLEACAACPEVEFRHDETTGTTDDVTAEAAVMAAIQETERLKALNAMSSRGIGNPSR